MNIDENKGLNFVTHLECSKTGKEYPANKIIGLSEDNAPLLVRYDLEALSQSMDNKVSVFSLICILVVSDTL